jgi:hypothetical protein
MTRAQQGTIQAEDGARRDGAIQRHAERNRRTRRMAQHHIRRKLQLLQQCIQGFRKTRK